MKLFSVAAALVSAFLFGGSHWAKAAPYDDIPVTAVTVGDRTCLHLENPDGAVTFTSFITYEITDPNGVPYDDGSVGYVTSWSGPHLTWACVPNATLAAAGTGWMAEVKITRAKSAGGVTRLTFF